MLYLVFVLQLLDRIISIGQKVKIEKSETTGTVIGSSESATLLIHDTDYLIVSETPISVIQPLSVRV